MQYRRTVKLRSPTLVSSIIYYIIFLSVDSRLLKCSAISSTIQFLSFRKTYYFLKFDTGIYLYIYAIVIPITLFCCYQYNPICSACSVECGGRRSFQYTNICYIIGVNILNCTSDIFSGTTIDSCRSIHIRII